MENAAVTEITKKPRRRLPGKSPDAIPNAGNGDELIPVGDDDDDLANPQDNVVVVGGADPLTAWHDRFYNWLWPQWDCTTIMLY